MNELVFGQWLSVWLSHGHRKNDFDALRTLVKNHIQATTAKLNDALVDVQAHSEFICEAIENLFIAFVLLSSFDDLLQVIAVFAL